MLNAGKLSEWVCWLSDQRKSEREKEIVNRGLKISATIVSLTCGKLTDWLVWESAAGHQQQELVKKLNWEKAVTKSKKFWSARNCFENVGNLLCGLILLMQNKNTKKHNFRSQNQSQKQKCLKKINRVNNTSFHRPTNQPTNWLTSSIDQSSWSQNKKAKIKPEKNQLNC